LVALLALTSPPAARAEPEFPTSKLIGPLFGIAWGPKHRAHLTGGIEGGIGIDELLVFNVGSTWRGDELFSYVELDGWYLVGGTVGVGHGTRDGWQPVVGVWEPLPYFEEVDPGCDDAELIVFSVGYRYTGLHEVYVTGKYGDEWTPCFN
jgi:hypothetical protein